MIPSHNSVFRFIRLFNSSFNSLVYKTSTNFVQTAPKINKEEKRRNNSSVFWSSAFVGVGLLSYYFYKMKNDLFPTVAAFSSKRKQFNFIADVVEQSVSALVNIAVIDSARVDFFTGQSITETNGSGFIVHEDGLILTNAHVVMSRRSRTKLKIKLYDGSTYEGIVEDVDLKADLATVRINAGKKLPTMKLGSSQDTRVGEFVIAMGSPLSLANTITTGVISTVHRPSKDLRLFGKDMQYLQTDAMITFGNSGGPLVNLDGEVIGINAMKVSTGISFAIPIEYAKEFLKESDQRRKGISRSADITNPPRFIGITMLTLSPDLIRSLQQRKEIIPAIINSGVLVWKVMINSPAFRAGLQPGDIVTEINGQTITGASSVYKILEGSGDLKMTVYRQNQKFIVNVSPEPFS
uniref:Serine protease HTRA2, mitochondrial n=1 Tax=Riptortus pedestris TaxID=329032 RepID=R4WTU4_RIPPE|nr:serine protease htra2 [Riptortus pedestris]